MYIPPHIKVIAAAILFGSSGVFIKYLNLPVAVITFFRMAVPLAVITAWYLLSGKRPPLIRSGWMLTASALNALRMVLYFIGYTYASIGDAVILLYTWPVFATLYSAAFLGEGLDRRRVLAVISAVAGTTLIHLNKDLSFGNREVLGLAAILLSAAIYAVTVIIFKRESKSHTHWDTIFYQNLLGAFIFLPFALTAGPLPGPGRAGVAVLYALLIGVIGFGLFFSALRKLPASTASLLTYVEVLSGVAFGIALFSETLTWSVLAGGFLIILAAFTVEKTVKGC